jgi:enediyne biosynthesis protein E3
MFDRMRRRLLAIDPAEASFEKRGFGACDPEARSRLEAMIGAFVDGYNQALIVADGSTLASLLHRRFDDHHVGFAFEGVGMYLALLDLLLPGRVSSLRRFTDGAGGDHDYIAAVGAGFAVARAPWGLRALESYLAKLDPQVGWCVASGYGFHQGFFHHRRFIENAGDPPAGLGVYGCDLFDSGVGRSMWWVLGGDPVRIGRAIDGFPAARRAELWSGIGVACAYAGSPTADGLRDLYRLAGQHQPDLLSGVPFAARLRQKGKNYSAVTELACRVLLGISTDEAGEAAAAAAVEAGPQLRGKGITGAYSFARQRLVTEFSAEKEGRATQ